ncbi:MAG: hypothetical protein OEU54_03505 [Gemmatimonadota bacterium]|nr:hypothetical protein [Gemmatimonadota bacterium]
MVSTFFRSSRAISFAFILGVLAASGAVAQEGIVGDWEGTINSPQQGDIGMVVHVTASEDGTLSATLDVPSQAGFGLALEEVTFEEGVFSFGFSMVGPGTGYEGTMSEDGATITGMWSQGGGSVELNFARPEG